MIDHGSTLLKFLPAAAGRLREGNVERKVDEGMSLHAFASSEVVPQKDARTQTCWMSAGKKRVRTLN